VHSGGPGGEHVVLYIWQCKSIKRYVLLVENSDYFQTLGISNDYIVPLTKQTSLLLEVVHLSLALPEAVLTVVVVGTNRPLLSPLPGID
jgi:hypothetical protein